jgi:hypothetical protein
MRKIWQSTLKSSARFIPINMSCVPGRETNSEIRVTGEVFSTINRLLRLVEFVIHYLLQKMWIIYKNISRTNKVAHSFVPLTAMTQESLDFKTGFICSNTKGSETNWSYQHGHFFTEPQMRKLMAWTFRLCVNCQDKPRYLIRPR